MYNYEKEISCDTILDEFDFRELPRNQTRKRSAGESESHKSEKLRKVCDSQSLVSPYILNSSHFSHCNSDNSSLSTTIAISIVVVKINVFELSQINV